jgi:hypothetical protein
LCEFRAKTVSVSFSSTLFVQAINWFLQNEVKLNAAARIWWSDSSERDSLN